MRLEAGGYDAHGFTVRDLEVVVDGFTGAVWRTDGKASEALGRARDDGPGASEGLLSVLTPRARAPRGWRYPIDWEEAYVALHTSVFCNMACRYCQAAEHRRTAEQPAMEVQAAREAMEYAVFRFAERAPKVILAFAISGEPLLAWDTFVQLYDYGRSLAERTGKTITWGLNTNGLCLDARIIEGLGERPDVTLAISVDGPPEAHDAMRRTPLGTGTYDVVVRNAKRVLASDIPRLAQTHAVATLTAAYPHPDRVLQHLLDLGFRQVAIKPVRVPPHVGFGVNRTTLAALQQGYSDLAEYLFYDLTQDGGRAFGALLESDPFAITLRRVVSTHSFPLRCPAAGNTIAIAPDGSIYPCDATVGFADVRLGDVRRGIDSCARRRVMHCHVNKREACRECWARMICGGECHHVALLAGGFDVVDPAYCGLVQHMIREAIWLAFAVKDHGAPAFARMLAGLGMAPCRVEARDDLQGVGRTLG